MTTSKVLLGLVNNRQIALARLFRKAGKVPIVPIILLLPIFISGIFGPLITPHDPMSFNPAIALQPPAWMKGGDWTYILGTDKLGRDLLSQLIDGARASLLVAVVGVALAGTIGVLLGIIAGYFGGIVDNIIMRIVDIQMSIPGTMLMILFTVVLGPGLRSIIIVIALMMWNGYTRVIRGEVLSLKQRDFIALAKVTGCGESRILLKHVFPNIVNSVVVMATLQVGGAIMIEGGISFLGIGVQPPNITWGLIIAESRSYMGTAWWVPTFAGLALVITTMGSNLFGDWLRDELDPKMR